MARLGGIFIDVRAKTDKYKRDLANAKTMTERASIRMQKAISSISFAHVAASAAIAGAAIGKLALDGFRAMEKMKLSAASLASTITSFAKDADKDLAGTYQQALGYSEQLVIEMEKLNAQTVATGENLTAMVETMAQGGVLLDINNKEQIKGFLAIANALALITQGQNQDIQFRQEIRGLIQGEVRATNMLARLLSQRVGGSLKEHVKLWKEQGTLIESAGALLEGFQEGAKDLANTWLAVGTTMQTMYDRTLRGLMAPIYEDIIRMGKQITLNVLDQNSALNRNAVFMRTVVYKGWQDIKNITESIVDIIASFEVPLIVVGKITSMILDGWGQIFAILPAITNRLKLIVQSMGDILKLSFHLGEAFRNANDFNFKEAAKSWEKAKDDWFESGRKVGEAFSGGLLDEVEGRINTFNKDLSTKIKPPVLPPELKAPASASDKAKKATDIDLSGLFKPIGKSEIERDSEMFQQMEDAAAARLAVVATFNEEYAELGKTRFEIERDQLDRQVELWREAGIEKTRIDKMASDKSIQIAQAEQDAKLGIYQGLAGGVAKTFQMIAQAGGKQRKEAFIAYKAFAMAEAAIAGHRAYLAALGDPLVPPTVARIALANMSLGLAAVQVGMIAAASPPSYEVGTAYVPQTGLAMLHQGERVVTKNENQNFNNNNGQDQRSQEINIVNVTDASQLDRYLASSRGQNAIINSVGNNQRFKRMITA